MGTLAQPPDPPNPSRAVPYLTFRVGLVDLAMRADYVKAILPGNQLVARDQATVHAPVTDVAGFAMSGGRLLPVIDLARKLGLRKARRGRTPCIVVVELVSQRGGGRTEPYLSGFVADVVSDVISVRARDIHGDTLHTTGRPRRVIDPEQYLWWKGAADGAP